MMSNVLAKRSRTVWLLKSVVRNPDGSLGFVVANKQSEIFVPPYGERRENALSQLPARVRTELHSRGLIKHEER
jgi:hypothetical protein